MTLNISPKTTLYKIIAKYGLTIDNHRMPIEIPGIGRDDLARLFGELGFTVGAEIGVEQGAYSEVLLRSNPDLHLYCVDAWQAYPGYREHVSQEKLDGFYAATQARLAPYHVTFIRKWSIEAARDFAPESLDFVYIDANHTFRQVTDDIDEWARVVKPGGIVSGHDYAQRVNPAYQCHVVEVVKAWTEAWHISPWFVLGSREVKDGVTRDKPRSWMWVKT